MQRNWKDSWHAYDPGCATFRSLRSFVNSLHISDAYSVVVARIAFENFQFSITLFKNIQMASPCVMWGTVWIPKLLPLRLNSHLSGANWQPCIWTMHLPSCSLCRVFLENWKYHFSVNAIHPGELSLQSFPAGLFYVRTKYSNQWFEWFMDNDFEGLHCFYEFHDMISNRFWSSSVGGITISVGEPFVLNLWCPLFWNKKSVFLWNAYESSLCTSWYLVLLCTTYKLCLSWIVNFFMQIVTTADVSRLFFDASNVVLCSSLRTDRASVVGLHVG